MEDTVLPVRERREGREVGEERMSWVGASKDWMNVSPESLMAYSLVRERRPLEQPTRSSYSWSAESSTKEGMNSG